MKILKEVGVFALTVKFMKDLSAENKLQTIIKRSTIYNKHLKKYSGDIGKIPIPEKNLKLLEGKFFSIDDYINSDKRWKKILEFDESYYTFSDYTETLIKNWRSIRLMLNTHIPNTPVFNVVISPKLQHVYWKFKEKDTKIRAKNMYKVSKEAIDTLYSSVYGDIKSFIRHSKNNPDLSLHDLLITYNRDFSNEFLVLIDKYEAKGLNHTEIVDYFKSVLNYK